MKKFLLVLVAAFAVSAVPTQAARMFLAQPNQTLALQEEVSTDTIVYNVTRSACSYNPAGDAILPPSLAGRYYMIVSLYSSEIKYPQMQLHLAARDTMSITHDAIFTAIVYLEGDGQRVNGTDGEFEVEFMGYDAEAGGFATYDGSFWAALEDGRVMAGTFHGPMRFYNADRGAQDPYIPTHEEEPEAFERTDSALAPTKVLRNGQVLIVREGRMYDLCGRAREQQPSLNYSEKSSKDEPTIF